MAVTRRSALSRRLNAPAKDIGLDANDQGFWDDLYQRIREHRVVPIVGNAVRNNRIFDVDDDDNIGLKKGDGSSDQFYEALDHHASEGLPVNEELAELWARAIGYPLPDKPQLAKVAQFHRVISDDMPKAKRSYLHFLKECLLDVAEGDQSVEEVVVGLRKQLMDKSFSDIVAELDYPNFTQTRPDPLRTLAKLRLPIYVTTSYHDFLERALIAEDAETVRTHFCLWNMEPESVAPEHRPDPNYIPSREEPVVYHLHGYEKYPRSLVLSEDDHLDYLLELAQDTNANNPLIPLYLRTALEESSLLLLGYQIQDWDFRILYRGLINRQHTRLRILDRMYGIAIQLDPKYQEGIDDKEMARKYLNDYFKSTNFRVEWSSIDRFMVTLWDQWNQRINLGSTQNQS